MGSRDKDFRTAIRKVAHLLDIWLPWKIQYDRVPGLAVGVTFNGKLVYQRGFGLADIELEKPITTETSFRIASISKTFTAVAILQLAQKGKLRLDDRVDTYLPWFKAKDKNRDAHNITIRQLLSHTAGVFRDGIASQWADGVFPTAGELRRSISNKTVVYENSTRFKYSNFGFALLGEVIQAVCDMTYEQYVTRNIIKNLGMRCTAADYTPSTASWLAEGYWRSIPGVDRRECFPHIRTNAYAPATGFISNVPDLAKFLSALSLKRDDDTLLDRESKKIMMQAHQDTGVEGKSYGLGLDIKTIAKQKIIGHGGGFPGFTTHVDLDVENDIGVIALSNTNANTASVISPGILESIYHVVDASKEKGKHIADQQKYEGIYRARWNDEIVVGLDSHLISFDPRTNSPLKDGTVLKPKGRNTFAMETDFNFDATGESARFLFNRKDKKAKTLLYGPTPYQRVS